MHVCPICGEPVIGRNWEELSDGTIVHKDCEDPEKK